MRVEDTIHQVLAALRKRAGLSQNELGARTGFARSYITRVESGAVTPGLGSLETLAIGLGVPVWKLVRYAERLGEKGE